MPKLLTVQLKRAQTETGAEPEALGDGWATVAERGGHHEPIQ